MKIKEQKFVSYIYIIIILFSMLFTNLTQVYSASTNGYTIINSQTLLESNDLDSLKLNITELPVVTVTGTAKYTIADSAKFTPSDFKARSVTFRDVSSRR